MRKIYLTLLVAFLSTSMMLAQKKGDMYIGGALGLNAGLTNTSVTYEGTKESVPFPFSNQFQLSPTFGYFVADNFEINASLRYGLGIEDYFDDETNDRLGNSGNHQFTAGLGLNYHIRICDRFSYAPGVGFDFGFNDYFEKEKRIRSDMMYFVFGFGVDLGRFDIRVTDHFGVSLNLLRMNYELATTKTDLFETGEKLRYNVDNFSFTTGNIGLRYFF